MLIVLTILATCVSTARMGAVGVTLATHVASPMAVATYVVSPMAVLAGGETAVDGGVTLATQAVSHLAMLGTAGAGGVTLVIPIA